MCHTYPARPWECPEATNETHRTRVFAGNTWAAQAALCTHQRLLCVGLDYVMAKQAAREWHLMGDSQRSLVSSKLLCALVP